MYRKSNCTTLNISLGVGVSRMIKFYIKVFYVMRRALSGKLSYMQTGWLFLGVGRI